MKIEKLDFTVRTYHVLKRAGIDTVEQLRQKTDADLYRLRNAGARTVAEIRSKIGYAKTFADQIRAMSDEELAAGIFQLIYAADPATWFCTGKKECAELMDADKDIPDEMCKACLLAKLRQPAEKPPLPFGIHDDKQESGLLEDD